MTSLSEQSSAQHLLVRSKFIWLKGVFLNPQLQRSQTENVLKIETLKKKWKKQLRLVIPHSTNMWFFKVEGRESCIKVGYWVPSSAYCSPPNNNISKSGQTKDSFNEFLGIPTWSLWNFWRFNENNKFDWKGTVFLVKILFLKLLSTKTLNDSFFRKSLILIKKHLVFFFSNTHFATLP